MDRVKFGPSRSFKRRSLHGMQALLGRTCLPEWYARSRCLNGAIILMYHSVASRRDSRWIDPRNHVSPERFADHAKFLARNRTVISLADLMVRLEANEPIAAGTVVITFDDGYRDNLTHAFTILEQYGLPATLFLPTRYVDNVECQWIDRLYTAFTARSHDELTAQFGGDCVTYKLRTHADCVRAYAEASRCLLASSYEARQELLRLIDEQLKPSTRMPRLTMSWDELREAARAFQGIDVGSHTVTHMDLAAHAENVVSAELSESKRRLESELPGTVRHFAFPYNRVSNEAIGMLEELGYEAAVAGGEDARIADNKRRYCLPRVEAPHSLSRLAFLTSGAYPELSKRLVGRA